MLAKFSELKWVSDNSIHFPFKADRALTLYQLMTEFVARVSHKLTRINTGV